MFMSKLFNSIVHENFQSQGQFWGKEFQILNTLKPKSEQQIFDYQLSKLKSQLDNSKSLKGYGNVKAVYDDSLKNIDLLKQFYDNEVPNHILEQIMTIMNAPFKAGSFRKEYYRKDGTIGTYTDYKEVAKAIEQVSEDIEKNSQKYGFGTVTLEHIQYLQKLLKKRNKNGISIWDYIQQKAGTAEQLTADTINNSEIYKNYYAFVTGSLEKKGHGQLIQDVMTVSKEDLNKKFSNGRLLTYTIKGEGEKSVGSLMELLDAMEKSSSEHHLVLSDELYDELTKASVLSVQTKSGIDQKIINANKQRQIALQALITGDQSGPAQAIRALKKIEKAGRENNIQYFKESFESEEIQSWANYLLGKDIAKLLHFGKDQTHILFTDHGFETPYTWMKRTQMMLKFDAIINKIDSDFTTTKRFYNLQKRNK